MYETEKYAIKYIKSLLLSQRDLVKILALLHHVLMI